MDDCIHCQGWRGPCTCEADCGSRGPHCPKADGYAELLGFLQAEGMHDDPELTGDLPEAPPPGSGICDDPRCRCDDPVCICHHEKNHQGQPPEAGLDYRVMPGSVNVPMEPAAPDYTTVTISEGW